MTASPLPRSTAGSVVAHLVGAVAAPVVVAEAEAAEGVPAPALDGATDQQRAGVEVAGRDRGDDRTGAEIDEGQGVAHLVRLIAAVLGVAEAELADGVVSPALELAAREHGAAVGLAGRDRGGRLTGAEVGERQAGAHLPGVVAARQRVAVTGLAALALAPALDPSAGQEGAVVAVTDGDLEDPLLARAVGRAPVVEGVAVVAQLARGHDVVAARAARAVLVDLAVTVVVEVGRGRSPRRLARPPPRTGRSR
jgi:hypothetical protein